MKKLTATASSLQLERLEHYTFNIKVPGENQFSKNLAQLNIHI